MATNFRYGFFNLYEFNIIPVALSGSYMEPPCRFSRQPDSSMGIF